MQGSTALAATLVSAALAGCGQEARVAPARIEITQPPPAAVVAERAAVRAPADARPGRVRSGTLRTRPRVRVPAGDAPSLPAQAVPAELPARRAAGRFRATHLQALRAHCATRPSGDPRCVDGDVDERVALAAFEGAR